MTQLRKRKFENSIINIRRRELNNVYKDIVCPLLVRTVGANRPTQQPFIGNIGVYRFAVNDWVEFEPVEAPHDWVEGSEVEFHIHWATGGDNDGTPRGVKWELEYAFANMEGIFTNNNFLTAETIIQANEPSRLLKYTQLGKVKFPQGKIGGQLIMRLTRIASTAAAPNDDVFGFELGVHYMCDALGSKTMSKK